MKLVLTRRWRTSESVIGTLDADDKQVCYMLELPDDGKYGKGACIPEGTYEVVIDFSNRFKKQLPHLLAVPGRSGIRIHAGNTARDTEGCLLPGLSKGENRVLQSLAALQQLVRQLQTALQWGKVYITVCSVPVGTKDASTSTPTGTALPGNHTGEPR